MTLLSSKGTFFQKRVFPLLWFGFLGVFVFTAFILPEKAGQSRVFFLIGPVVMAVVFSLVYRFLIYDLADEVYDLGDALIVKNKGMEVRLPLTNIINVSTSAFTNPPRVTLRLREPCALGKNISFMLPTGFNPFKRSKVGEELADRIDALRMRG